MKINWKEVGATDELLEKLCGMLKCNKVDLLPKIDKLINLKMDLEKKLEELKQWKK